MEQRSDQEAKDKVFELIKDIHVALLVTHSKADKLSARPMSAVAIEKFDGDLWFFTPLDTPKSAEIAANPDVLLSYANPDKQDYVSIRGKATIIRDQEKIDEYWTEMLRAWFPEGKNDPSIGLIKVSMETAEFWDSPSSPIAYLYGYGKAALTGERSKNLGDTGRVDFRQKVDV
jgi:general stress protein 26